MRVVNHGAMRCPWRSVVPVMLVGGLAGPIVSARDWVGGGATNNWSDGANWSPVGPPANPVAAGEDLTFDATKYSAANVDVPWTVNSLMFKGPHLASSPASFTLTGSPISVRGGVFSGAYPYLTIENDVVLTGTNNGRGPEVEFGIVSQAVAGVIVLDGAISGPGRIHIGSAYRVDFIQFPQNAGGPIGGTDPGVNYGAYLDNPSGFFFQRPTSPGTYTYFGNASTAIGIRGGGYAVSGEVDGQTTITNAFRILDAGTTVSTIYTSTVAQRQQRLNLSGPMMLQGRLALRHSRFTSNPGQNGYGIDLQGTITVAGTNASIIDLNGDQSEDLISGNITQDGVARTLTLGLEGAPSLSYDSNVLLGTARVLSLSGDNTGLTGGMRLIGLPNPGPFYNQTTAFGYRFLKLASMGGGGKGNVFVGPQGTAGIGFAMSDAALDKIDPASTGTIGIDADSSLDIDLSAAGHNLPLVKIGTTRTFPQAVHYTGHITPFGDTYFFGGGGGTLNIDAANALSGARNLNIATGASLILNAPQSFTGSIQISGGLTVNKAGAIDANRPIALNGFFGIGTGAPGYAHQGDITLGANATIGATQTGNPGYDLLLNGSVRGGSAGGSVYFIGGTTVLNGANNDLLSPVSVGLAGTGGFTMLLVHSSLKPSDAVVTVNNGRLGGDGVIARPVKMGDTASLAPGGYLSPTGTLTITSLQFQYVQHALNYEFNFDAAEHDFLKVALDIVNPNNSTAVLKLLPLAGGDALGQTVPFLEFDGTQSAPFTWTVDASLAPGYQGSFVTFDPASQTYSVTLVPEPTGLVFLVGMALLARRRSRWLDR
jgi:hypothetical protein